jgi:hypothetical protein
LRYLDDLGADRVFADLTRLPSASAPFTPCEVIARAGAARAFYS